MNSVKLNINGEEYEVINNNGFFRITKLLIIKG